MSKNLDETVCLHSEKRREWVEEIRGERLLGIAEGTSSTPRLASSSAALFPGRNECPGTHCSLIVQEEREDSFCQRVYGQRKDVGGDRVARVREEEKRSENAGLLMLPRPAKSLQNGRGFMNILGLPKRRLSSVPQSEQLASTPEPSLLKGKRTEPDDQIVRWEKVKVSESCTLVRERGIRAGAWVRKSGLHSEGGRFLGGEGGQARRASLREVEGSMSW